MREITCGDTLHRYKHRAEDVYIVSRLQISRCDFLSRIYDTARRGDAIAG